MLLFIGRWNSLIRRPWRGTEAVKKQGLIKKKITGVWTVTSRWFFFSLSLSGCYLDPSGYLGSRSDSELPDNPADNPGEISLWAYYGRLLERQWVRRGSVAEGSRIANERPSHESRISDKISSGRTLLFWGGPLRPFVPPRTFPTTSSVWIRTIAELPYFFIYFVIFILYILGVSLSCGLKFNNLKKKKNIYTVYDTVP